MESEMTEEQIKAGLDEIVEAARAASAANVAEIEIYLVVDTSGDYEVGVNEDDATERFGENIAGDAIRHMIKMTITVPLPRTIEVSAALPEREDGGYGLEIKS
jgi:hypothetical protein